MRTTKARTLIEDIITTAPAPLDTKSLLELVHERDETIDRATVFRTVNAFVKDGRITKVDFGDGKARYESASHHHHHLICTKCHRVQSVDICHAEDVIKSEAAKLDFTVVTHKLEYFGLCGSCSAKIRRMRGE